MRWRGCCLAGSVPSLEHEVLVDLVRECPSLAPQLLRICAGIDVGGTTSELGSIDVSQVMPTEYRADAVVKVRDANGELVAAVLVEIQLRPDPIKRWTWPVYVATLRASLRCPVTLLVLAELPGVARWARARIDLGHPHFCLRPVAISFADVPALARSPAELVVLSALAHPDDLDLPAVVSALSALPDDRARLYLAQLVKLVPEHHREELEAGMLNIDPAAFAAELAANRELRRMDEVARKIALTKVSTLSIDEDASISSLDGESLGELLFGLATAIDEAGARAALALAVRRCMTEQRTRY